MARKRISASPTLPDLIRRTSRLKRILVLLLKRFPESGTSIFPLLNRWRLDGDATYESAQTAAAEWTSQYGDYIRDLEGYISHVMLRPDLFSGLPFNSRLLDFSAVECIRRLSLQEAALKRMQADDTQRSRPSMAADLDSVCDGLRAAVKRNGTKHVMNKTQLSRDTIGDIIARRVVPQKPTIKKLKDYLLTERTP